MLVLILVLLTAGILIGTYLYLNRREEINHEEILPADLARRMLAKYEQMQVLAGRITSDITVSDIMSAAPNMLSEDDSVAKIRKTMSTMRVHHALVQDKHSHLSGIISDRDLALRHGSRAWQIMTADPISVSPDCSPMRAVGLMVSKRISCLPVAEGYRLCGLVTTTDLILALEALLKVVAEIRADDRATSRDEVFTSPFSAV